MRSSLNEKTLLTILPISARASKGNIHSRDAFVRQRDASRNYNATDRLGTIHVPTLTLHGKKDGLAPYALAEELHNGIADSKMITFNGGHLFLFQKREQFLNAVVDFLESQRMT